MQTTRAVILDRDGVINQDTPLYVKKPEEWIPIQSSLEAIALLNQKGIKVFIATNQSGLARGYFSENDLKNIHDKMHQCLRAVGGWVDGIHYCPHGPDDGCGCRKPQPGLLLQIQESYQIQLADTPFIGDSYRDIEAGRLAGCQAVLVKTGNGSSTLKSHKQQLDNVLVYDNLNDFITQNY